MKTIQTIASTILLTLLISACKMNFNANINGGAELKGEGITFLVPTETSSSSSGSGGIEYDGETVKAKTDGKALNVNGVNYGQLKVGDVVNLREKGKVYVNDVERNPVPKQQAEQDVAPDVE